MKKTISAGPTPVVWNADALFAKAVLYSEVMLRSEVGQWQRGLMAALALEFVSRAALSNVSPTLLADTSKNWHGLHHALGFQSIDAKPPISIATNDVLSRLSSIFSSFTKEVLTICIQLSAFRNAELHSGDTPFSVKGEQDWQPGFYRACGVLLTTMGLSLEDLVGKAEADVASKLIAADDDKSAKAVAGDISAYKKVWDGKKTSNQKKLMATSEVWATKHDGHRVKCPSCNCRALVFGDPVLSPKVELDDGDVVEKQSHLPTHFECIACGLKISGLSRLNAAGIGDRYTRTIRYGAAEYYAPEDNYPDYEDDNNE